MKSEQINELATALAKAQSEIKSAHKDTTNPFFKSKYADLTSVWEACRAALNKNGLSVVQTINSTINTLRDVEHSNEVTFLQTTLLHTSGQWISGECPLLNAKGDMQGLGSAISYARRYGLSAIVGVTADDDDGELASQPKREDISSSINISPCTPAQAKMIHAKLNAKGIRGLDAANLLNPFGTHLPERIPFVSVDQVVKAIEAYTVKRNPKIPVDREDEPQFDPDIGWAQK